MKTVWIIQPYVPRYRTALFEQLAARLAQRGVHLRIGAGTAEKEQAERGDEARPDWLEPITWTRVGLLQLSHSRRLYHRSDAVIFPHLGSNPELTIALAERALGRSTRVGIWGHIRNYVGKPHPLDAAIERWQLRRADMVFAYTATGASFARETGVAPDRVITLNNTIDTDELKAAIDGLSEEEVRGFQAQHKLVSGRTIAYIGGIDMSKRIDLLVAVLDRLWETEPDVKMLVGGLGSAANLLAPAEARGQVVRLGYVDAKVKALIAASARLLVNPGRVGLLAVEALVMRRPIVTTAFPYHAPEIEYLVEGETLFTSLDTVDAYAQLISRRLGAESAGPTDAALRKAPALSDMVDRFTDGITRMLPSLS